MIIYMKGDLFKDAFFAVAHGVNCQGVMGSGFAKQIKEKYPWSYQHYLEFCKDKKPEELLGRVKKSYTKDSPIIYHCFTQLKYGKPDVSKTRYVSYDAIDECMKEIAWSLKINEINIYYYT